MEKEKKDSFLKNYLVDTAAGSVSGAGAAIVTHPLDTFTVRAQAGSGKGSDDVNFREVGNLNKKKKENIKFDHFKTSRGRRKIKRLVRNSYSGLSPRLAKTMVAGAIGYPLFTGSQKLINDTMKDIEGGKRLADLEKTAAVGAALKTIGKFVKKHPKGSAIVGSTGLAIGAGSLLSEETTLEKAVKNKPKNFKKKPNRP